MPDAPLSGLHEAIEAVGQHMARLVLVDLHVHSPESCGDYRGSETDAKSFLAAVLKEEPELRVLAITDHNRCRFACEVAGLAGPTDLLVLPGIEIDVALGEWSPDRVHVLAIFPATKSTEGIYSVVTELGGPDYGQLGPQAPLQCRLQALVDVVDAHGGICVAAHVNSSQGTRDWARKSTLELVPSKKRINQLKQTAQRSDAEEAELEELTARVAEIEDSVQRAWLTFLSNTKVTAIEVSSEDDVPYYRGHHLDSLGLRQVACILSSDAHAPEEVAPQGRRTYMRLSGQSFSCVRAALSDPETRIRFSLPRQDRNTIEGIRFTTAGEGDGGFFGQCAMAFSENLTCIIGPRGSGKSALIEALRFALGADIRGDQRIRDDAEARRAATLGETAVEVLLSPGQQQPVVAIRSLAKVTVLMDASSGQPVDAPLQTIFRADIYGWSEIEQLGGDAEAQRRLLDAHNSAIVSAKKLIGDCRKDLLQNRAEAVAEARKLRELAVGIAELPAVRRRMQALSAPEVSKAFASADSLRHEASLIREQRDALSVLLSPLLNEDVSDARDVSSAVWEWYGSLSERLSDADGPGAAVVTSGEFSDAIGSVVSKLADLSEVIAELLGLLDQAMQDVDTAAQAAVTSAEQSLVEHFRTEIEAGKQTEQQVRALASQREATAGRLAELTKDAQSHGAAKKALDALLTLRRHELIPALVQAHKHLSSARKAATVLLGTKLSELADQAPVSIDVEGLSDRTAFENTLSGAGGAAALLANSGVWAYRERSIAKRIADAMLPWEFSDAILNSKLGSITGVLQEDNRDGDEDAERLRAHLSPSGDTDADYDPDKLDCLLVIDETAVDDRPVIKLGDTPIERLSPGQRCTALLPIIMTEGDWPLVIDQPEDNLDNAMVFQVVVDVLRQLKDKRQVIVATHNPNIPVSGDAEQLLVLKGLSHNKGQLVAHGAVDYPHVVELITEIMEGGEEAFRMRAVKYGFDIQRSVWGPSSRL